MGMFIGFAKDSEFYLAYLGHASKNVEVIINDKVKNEQIEEKNNLQFVPYYPSSMMTSSLLA